MHNLGSKMTSPQTCSPPWFDRNCLTQAGRFSTGAAVCLLALVASQLAAGADDPAQPLVVEERLVHLRNDPTREWSSFPEIAEADHLEVRFAATRNAAEYALRLRQQDVKQVWRVLLNGKPLGQLVRDEMDQVIYFPVPAGLLVDGNNVLRIETSARGPAAADDIRVGQIKLDTRPLQEVLDESKLHIRVVDADSKQPLPARITIANADGSLQTTAAASNDKLAVRPGVIYTADGEAHIDLPAGTYTVYAGRGFEYSVARVEATLAKGQSAEHTLAIRREVPTPGYVACDTHIHTLTHSGHGDASISERMITLAGEGIELPIATDHNVHIDYDPHAAKLGVRKHFTPVIGNEVTTAVGHFNVFPIQPQARVPDHRAKDWPTIFDEIFATPGVKVAILNHGRDVHSGVRPFGPDRFNAASGDNLLGWPMRFNAMEVINSGATQTDPLRLIHDWMTLLNRGHQVTPVGSSDSHDVSRYIVGQGRTYIRCDDSDSGKLDIDEAVASFLQGRVLVSYGLIAELTINDKYRSGDLAAADGRTVKVAVRVLGPDWTTATKVQLYANGALIRDEQLPMLEGGSPGGLKWEHVFELERPKHDVFLAAVAIGPGVDGPYWQTAKPYQPTSPDWTSYVLGLSGAVWVDGDGDGRPSSARDYATMAMAESGGDPKKIVASLAKHDLATAIQAAALYTNAGGRLDDESLAQALATAPKHVADGIRRYQETWRESERARAAQ